jgi:glycosyltransferase involved in cell wall biosynthesis
MKNNKKIFIAAEIFPPEVGGPATYAVNLANTLNSQGWDVRILCYGKPDKGVLNNGIKINWVLGTLPIYFKYLYYFRMLCWFSRGYKTIYAMGPVASGLPASWVAELFNKKLIVKVVGDYAWEQAMNSGKTNLLIDDFQKEKFGGKIGKLQKIERQVCKKADVVITPSEYLKNIVKDWGVEKDKIKVVYNSYNINRKYFISADEEKKRNNIVSVGRLVPWKGFETLIKVIYELNKEGNNFKLNIVGKGPEKEKLLKIIKEQNLEDNIKINYLKQEKVGEAILNSEIFVLNTGYEGLSHVILETLGAGTPVITTNVGGNPELIQNGFNGTLVEYNNKKQLKKSILDLHNDVKLKQKYIKNGDMTRNKPEFSGKKMIKDTINVVENL